MPLHRPTNPRSFENHMISKMDGQNVDPCERCGSRLIVAVGQQLHCNECGHDFNYDKNIIGTAARKARERARGWPHRSEP
jgi:tRNA(Ile2) C34 agmatinyltransferase TiaS